MAHKKGAGSSRNGRESHSKRLGIKIFGGQPAIAGNIIVRQRGTKHNPGLNVGIGRDHTLFALAEGVVTFKKKADNRSYVSVLPFAEEVVEVAAPAALIKAEKTPAADKAKAAEASVDQMPVAEPTTPEATAVHEGSEANTAVEQAPKAKKVTPKKKDADSEEKTAD